MSFPQNSERLVDYNTRHLSYNKSIIKRIMKKMIIVVVELDTTDGVY
jgi:hypothetical protein